MCRYRRRLMLCLLAVGLIAMSNAGAQSPPSGASVSTPDDPESYPNFTGREETFGLCSACHSFRVVAAQGLTREQWDGSLTWMTQKHKMPEPEPADREVLLGYLAKAFPPKLQPTGRAGWRNPFGP